MCVLQHGWPALLKPTKGHDVRIYVHTPCMCMLAFSCSYYIYCTCMCMASQTLNVMSVCIKGALPAITVVRSNSTALEGSFIIHFAHNIIRTLRALNLVGKIIETSSHSLLAATAVPQFHLCLNHPPCLGALSLHLELQYPHPLSRVVLTSGRLRSPRQIVAYACLPGLCTCIDMFIIAWYKFYHPISLQCTIAIYCYLTRANH